jgi:hypothetical protein
MANLTLMRRGIEEYDNLTFQSELSVKSLDGLIILLAYEPQQRIRRCSVLNIIVCLVLCRRTHGQDL